MSTTGLRSPRTLFFVFLSSVLSIVPAGAGFASSQSPAPSAAQSESPQEVEEKSVLRTDITVAATPAPDKMEVTSDIRALPANASVLFDPATEVSNAREPGEIIRALPGMDFVFYGQGGIPSGPSVRGYTDRNFGQDMAGFLDGIPLNLFGFVASHGALDLTTLLPQSIERVELIRGPFNSRYGDFHRGGSLNFVTKSGIARSSADVAVGSFGTVRANLTYGRAPSDDGRVSFFTTLDGYRTNSYSRNSDLNRVNGYLKVLVPVGATRLSVAGSAFASDWDAPSYLDLAQIRSGAVSDRDFINVSDGGKLQSQTLYATLRGGPGSDEWSATGWAIQRSWDRWRHDQLISPATTQLHQNDERLTLGMRAEHSFSRPLFGRPSLLLAGITAQRDDAETMQERTRLRSVVTPVDAIDEVLTNSAVYLQEQLSVTSWLKVSAGARFNRLDYELDDRRVASGLYVSSYEATRVNPNLGVAVKPFGSERILIYANTGSGMRSPTPRTEVRNSVNSLDRVEIAETRNYEVGISLRLGGGFEVQADAFQSNNTNEIRAIPPGIEFESLGKSRRKGAETDLTWFSPARTTRLYMHLSWVEARLTTPVNPAAVNFPDVARYVHKIGLEKTVATGVGGILLGGDLALYGPKELNTLGTIRSEKYQRATARATYVPASARYRVWAGGFYYPASRFGESAFLFGSRVGVRANPRTSFETGVSFTF